MTQQPDLDAVARAILDVNHYMTLGTADAGASSLYRLYRATVTQHWVLDLDASPDQRTPVSP